ncbi:MAG: archaellin/type IV pilin N-terminal domain-containing protein [Nitrososphaerota archaeon]|nr:archaellin/type IV pilin N-terminal domain-containing protein [Nitrososphaerota archaeon]
MKILKSRKALSPVVASIILIAVTVAVSIAVAAWMGALTFTFMRTEPYNIVLVSFNGVTGSSSNNVTLRIQNTGTASFTIDVTAKVNGLQKSVHGDVTARTIPAGEYKDITITNVGWQNGRTYNIELVTTQGTKITWVGNAPQT